MFYVYKWYIEETNEIFYIGKGTKDRYKQTKKRNKLFLNIYNNNKCKNEIIQHFENEIEAFEKEHELICYYKSIGQCKCNLDNGGKGGVNYTWTPEMREYYSKYNVMKNENQRKRMSISNPMKNPDIAKKVGEKISRPFYIGNKLYKNLKEAAKEYNVADTAISYWLKKKYNRYDEICYYENEEKPKIDIAKKRKENYGNTIIYKNKEYNTQKELAKELNITETCLIRWISLGYDDVGNEIRIKGDSKTYYYNPNNYRGYSSPIYFKGVYYNSVNECVEKTHYSKRTIRYHLQKNNKENYYVNQKPSNRKPIKVD